MSLLARLLRPSAVNLMDDRLWTASTIGSTAYSGVYVSAETALMSSAVWACTRLIAESIATMPTITYRRLRDGKERAPDHPLYTLLHDEPNAVQTAFTWKRTMMVHALLYGGGYSRIMPGPRGPVDHLDPIHPDDITVEGLAGGGIRYMVRGDDGVKRPVNAEDILHLPGLSLDGVQGLSLVKYARESIGLALAAEGYSAKFYSQNAQPGGVLTHPNKLSKEAAERVAESWQAAHSGLNNAYKVAVLEEGLDWKQTGMTHADAELIAQLDWSAADIARFFNVPLHMIQLMTKSTSWGSGLEEMGVGFVVFTLLPWVKNWEQIISKRLILAPQTYFVEFLLDSLMRGKQQDRYNAYAMGRQWGWLSVNDIRRMENMNPVPDGDGYLEPMNMREIGAEPEPAAPPTPPPAPPPGRNQGHYQLLLHEAATRIIRKEVAAMSKLARRTAGDPDAWRQGVAEFYMDHAAFVAETLRINKAQAEAYCTQQGAALIANGAAIMEDWETRRAGDLIALALGGAE